MASTLSGGAMFVALAGALLLLAGCGTAPAEPEPTAAPATPAVTPTPVPTASGAPSPSASPSVHVTTTQEMALGLAMDKLMHAPTAQSSDDYGVCYARAVLTPTGQDQDQDQDQEADPDQPDQEQDHTANGPLSDDAQRHLIRAQQSDWPSVLASLRTAVGEADVEFLTSNEVFDRLVECAVMVAPDRPVRYPQVY